MSLSVKSDNNGISAGMSSHMAGVKNREETVQKWRKRNEKKKMIKRSLNYNPREIANQLVQASKSRVAAVVLIRAKGKLVSLQQAYVSEQYDQAEVRTALDHAKRMVECSRLKVRNLKEEEQLKTRNDKGEDDGKIKRRREVRKRVKKKEQELKVKLAIEEGHRVLKEKQRQQELRQKRRLHRNEELGKISEADMKYMEDKLRERENSHSVDDNGVVLELSGASAQLTELKMMEQQVEQQVEMEVEMSMSAADFGGSSLSSADLGTASGGGSVGVSEMAAATVDVSV